ncbi:MAG: M48 family metallopeptidase [Luminiphilus sp.]|nr:M48 family metallopeptidase [Luminiphilus sp.]
MDFFRDQEVARRNARLLTALFVLAVLLLIAVINLFLAFVLTASQTLDSDSPTAFQLSDLDIRLTLLVSIALIVVIGAVVLYNWIRFSQGGRSVAEALGARPAVSNTKNPLERRAQNVVQEIALAANMPVPPLYILDKEPGINAFAAGISPGDAVVAITQGAMTQLTRDELQGVIGHEFSHILNGDMRLSIRLMAMLRGITFIGDMGAVLMRSAFSHRARRSSNNSNSNTFGLLLIGLGLYFVGLLGGVMAGLIKSAISKQKEYLADASSVQFTRNPRGISNALKVIGGYTPGTLVDTARAEEMSHLFFGQVKHRLWLMFSTHPPLENRILRVDPHWNGEFITRQENLSLREAQASSETGIAQAQRSLAAALPLVMAPEVDNIATSNQQASETTWFDQPPEDLTATLIEEAREPLGAMSLLLALLWHENTPKKQRAAIREAKISGLEALVVQRGRELQNLKPELRLPLIELCLPTLKTLSSPQYNQFKGLLINFVKADGQIELFEWCLYQLVRHYLDPHFIKRSSKPQYAELKVVSEPLTVALGTLALLGHGDTDTSFALGAQVLDLPLVMPAVEAMGVQQFGKAIEQLANCYPLLKVTIIKALTRVAEQDGHISPKELTLIKAIGAVMDCPLPNQVLHNVMLSR